MLWAAFITGLIGSLHCTGMCGPLICAMPIRKKTAWSETSGLVFYNMGRIASYVLLGGLFGLGGAAVANVVGTGFTYLAGICLIALGIYKWTRGKRKELQMPTFMKKWMGKLFRTRSRFTLPLLGMLNGLIPCGAVYAALAGASATAGPLDGMSYMLVFGLATWPAIFSGYYLTGKIIRFFRGYYRPATAIFLMIIGILLIIRPAQVQKEESHSDAAVICR